MKRLLFLASFLLAFLNLAHAQTHRALIRNGHGATKPQEIGQAVFSAFQQNKFDNLSQFLPDEVELRQLKRHSSEDMRGLLQKLTPDSIKQNLQREFASLSENSTANGFNWQDFTLADTKLIQTDKKNPALYKMQISFSNAASEEKYLLVEVLKVRNRYFLFRQIAFQDRI